MRNSTRKTSVPLSTDAVQIIRGLIFGELITILIIGGLWLWLRPRLVIDRSPTSTYNQDTDTTSVPPNASTFQSIPNIPIGSFNYGGSTTWVPIRQLVDSSIQNARPEINLHYVNPDSSPGSGEGIRMLLNGKLDFVQSSRPLTATEYALAQQRGFTLSQSQIGTDGVAVVANRTLEVPGLTVEQLRQIYLGKITNWKQLGGPNLAITAFSQRPENADAAIFSSKQDLSSNIHYVYSTTEALRRVSQTPGGLYFASARAVVPQCTVKSLPLGITTKQLVSLYRQPPVPLNQCPLKRNQLNPEVIKNGSYPMTAKLFVIIKQDNGRQQQVGVVYSKLLLTDQGQRAIKQAGFIPVR
ncbi:MAG: substrate-binding domain-containing protein [Rhizonema sp. PD38]|nr:substrate-binding domain-containing protein [Rhizonema sp. PD38]